MPLGKSIPPVPPVPPPARTEAPGPRRDWAEQVSRALRHRILQQWRKRRRSGRTSGPSPPAGIDRLA